MIKKELVLPLLLVFLAGALVGNWSAPHPPPKPYDPPEAPLKGATIRLGYIAPTTTSLETGRPYREKIIQADMNAYAQRLGYDLKVEWVIDEAKGETYMHLAKVQALKQAGVSVFEGGGWSSTAAASLNYCNVNRLLMWSSSSTSSILSLPEDCLYRLSPPTPLCRLRSPGWSSASGLHWSASFSAGTLGGTPTPRRSPTPT